jgi:hypothetical protein
MQCRKLTVDIGWLHRVGIHQGQLSHSCPAQHLGGIRSYSSQSYYQHMRPAQAFCLVLAQQQFRTLLPLFACHAHEFFLNHL